MGPSGRQIDLTQTPPNASSSGDSAPRSLADTEASLQQQIKEGTSLDTVVARLVVEQGLATSDEVEAAMSHVRANPNDASLVQWLHMSKYPPALVYSLLELGSMELLLVAFLGAMVLFATTVTSPAASAAAGS